MDYEHGQIQRVLDDGPDAETGGVFRLKITGRISETKWLSVTGAQVRAIQSLLSSPDARYTARKEGAGNPDKPWVARFVGAWLGSFATEAEAIQATCDAHAERMRHKR